MIASHQPDGMYCPQLICARALAASPPLRVGEIQAHHLVVALGRILDPVADAGDLPGIGPDHVAAPVDQLHQLLANRRLGVAAGRARTPRQGRQAMVAEQQPRRTEPRGDEFLQPQRGGRLPPEQLGHEDHPRLLDAAADRLGLVRLEARRRGRSKSPCDARRPPGSGASRTTAAPRGGWRRCPPGRPGRESHRPPGPKLRGRQLGPAPDLLADRADFQAVGQGPKRRQIAPLPSLSQTNQPEPKLHRTSHLKGHRPQLDIISARRPEDQ